jgi:hypothetical protein
LESKNGESSSRCRGDLDAKARQQSRDCLASPATCGPIHVEALRRPIHNGAMLYRGFPSKLDHGVPHWVETGALFHIRVAIDREKQQSPLIAAPFAQWLLDSARYSETKQHWHITLFLPMPDHL